MHRWDRLQERYIEEYRARGRAEATNQHVRWQLEDWGAWLKRRRPRVVLERLDPQLHVDYLAARSSFKAKSTVYGVLSKMRCFGDFLVREEVWASNPLRWMQGPKIIPYNRMQRRLDRAHLEALWRAAASAPGDYSRHLWVTVLALLYGTGLRRGELSRLTLDQIDRADGTIRLDGRKSGCERCVPLPEMVRRCLEVYWPARHNRLEATGRLSETALLVSCHGKRLSSESISNGVRRLACRAQIPYSSLHQFRHSCASDLLAAGVGIADVQQILGHASVATTVIYTHIADPARRAAMARHPLNDWLYVPERAEEAA
ncbi:MAG: tyrosine-type recombinase/integrase [Steroidobacteraceae bacterium]